MNQNNVVKNLSNLDSKRSATATRCRVIRGREIMALMYRHHIVPNGMIVDPDTGYSKESAAMLVIPFYLVEEFNSLMHDYIMISSLSKDMLTKIRDEQGEEAVLSIVLKELQFVKFLNKSVILATISATDPEAKGKVPSGEYDVMVDTIETQHSSAWLISKNRNQNNG